MLAVVTGPVRSGKSERAEALAHATGKPVTLAVTAAIDPADVEMNERIAHHRRARPGSWTVVETARATDLLPPLLRSAPAGTCIVVDALGTWLAAAMLPLEAAIEAEFAATQAALDRRCSDLVDELGTCAADVIVVAEAVGWDVVPPSAQGRLFRDVLGRATRALAARAERVELVVAGYALDLRAASRPM